MEGEREQPMFALLVRPNDKLRQDIVSERITAAIVAGYRNYMPDHKKRSLPVRILIMQ